MGRERRRSSLSFASPTTAYFGSKWNIFPQSGDRLSWESFNTTQATIQRGRAASRLKQIMSSRRASSVPKAVPFSSFAYSKKATFPPLSKDVSPSPRRRRSSAPDASEDVQSLQKSILKLPSILDIPEFKPRQHRRSQSDPLESWNMASFEKLTEAAVFDEEEHTNPSWWYHFTDYDIYEVSILNGDMKHILEHEGCALCTDSSKLAPYVILQCSLLQCIHIAHAKCVQTMKIDSLQTSHSTCQFLIRERQALPEASTVSSAGDITIKITALHMISSATFVSKSISSPRYLNLKAKKTAVQVLNMDMLCSALAARLCVEINDVDGTHVCIQGNVDLSRCLSSEQELVLIDPVSGYTIRLTTHINTMDTWVIDAVDVQMRGIRSVGDMERLRIEQPECEPFETVDNMDFPPTPSYESSDALYSSVAESIQRIAEEELLTIVLTQTGSRQVQDRIDASDSEYIDSVFPILCRNFAILMTDIFANYTCQKLYQVSSDSQKMDILSSLQPCMLAVTCDRQGTRVMQNMIRMSTTDEQYIFILETIKPLTFEMMFDPHGSYVINAILDKSGFSQCSFILDILCHNMQTLATNQHSLGVVKKALSCATETERKHLVQSVAVLAPEMIDDNFGNYVFQHVLSMGDSSSVQTLHESLRGHYCRLAKKKFSSNVIEKFLSFPNTAVQRSIIEELIAKSELPALLQDQFANFVMQNALSKVEKDQCLVYTNRIRPIVAQFRKKLRLKWEKLIRQHRSRVGIK